MGGCFKFQWGVCFSDGGGVYFKWGGAPWEGIGFDGRGVRKKSLDGGGGNPHAPSTMGNPGKY